MYPLLFLMLEELLLVLIKFLVLDMLNSSPLTETLASVIATSPRTESMWRVKLWPAIRAPGTFSIMLISAVL